MRFATQPAPLSICGFDESLRCPSPLHKLPRNKERWLRKVIMTAGNYQICVTHYLLFLRSGFLYSLFCIAYVLLTPGMYWYSSEYTLFIVMQ